MAEDKDSPESRMARKAASQTVSAMDLGKKTAKFLQNTRAINKIPNPLVRAAVVGVTAALVNGTAQRGSEALAQTAVNKFSNNQAEEQPKFVYRQPNRTQSFSPTPTPRMFDVSKRANTFPGALSSITPGFSSIMESGLQEKKPSLANLITELTKSTRMQFTSEPPSLTTSPTESPEETPLPSPIESPLPSPIESKKSLIEEISTNHAKIKIREKVKLPQPANDDGTYTMKQVLGCIDADINFNVKKTGNTYELSLPKGQEGRSFYQGNLGKFPIKVKLAASEENYREALDKRTMSITKNGQVKEAAEISAPKAGNKLSR